MTPSPKSWALVVPVKRLDVAKSRLLLAPPVRADVALAMAVDTVAACLRAHRVATVVVVTDDIRAAAAMSGLGAVVVADEPDAGLNPALRHGAAVAASRSPGAGVATVASDLPALRPADLDAVLDAAGSAGLAIVADDAGSGTTLLAAIDPARFVPAFGPGSRAAHVASGAIDLTSSAPRSVRRDVDTVNDLRDALVLGCGPATTEAVRAVPLPP